jgi:hypothetical protein
MSVALKVFAFIGVLSVFIFVVGLFLDVKSFDRTTGGYEPPYEGVTGEPVDWASMDLTSTGLVKRGYVVNVVVNGTTGMISFEILKQTIDWQVFSGRALAVHKPREALIQRGFKPEF